MTVIFFWIVFGWFRLMGNMVFRIHDKSRIIVKVDSRSSQKYKLNLYLQ
jgi:hypothetical protein